jgi:UDP-3-O-[3-hydroxymyristoyl] N-acetylglucosamine deacetylase/3-hydroxyacyl-[acyl-carrier-protein] dehydratase
MSKEPMRFDNEFARHKALDVIGDLMLSGKKFRGHVIAVKPGHGPNTEAAKRIKKEYAQMRAMVPPLKLPEAEAVLGPEDILKILPHRYPFLLIDRVTGFSSDLKCTAIKNLTMNEEFFQGHFPGHPVMPGVLQLEAMAQTASILIMRLPDNQGKIGYFLSANNVKFRKPVVPGDTLFVDAEITKMRRNIGQAVATCSVNGEIVSSAELKFAVM